jgi:hypothetical protein
MAKADPDSNVENRSFRYTEESRIIVRLQIAAGSGFLANAV